MASNLKKTSNLEVGSVLFYDKKKVFSVKNVKKDKECLKKILKNKKEIFPDLEKLKF